MPHEKRASSIRQVARCTLQVARFTCCCTSHVPRDIARCDTQRNWQSAKLISLEGEKLPPVGNACHTIIALFTCWLLIKIRESCTISSVKQAEVSHIVCTIYSSRSICKEREREIFEFELPFVGIELETVDRAKAVSALWICNECDCDCECRSRSILNCCQCQNGVSSSPLLWGVCSYSASTSTRQAAKCHKMALDGRWSNGAMERGCDSLKCSLCLAYWLKTVCIMRKPAKWQQGGSGSAEWDISSQCNKALAGNSNFPAKNADENMFLWVFVPSAPTLKSDCCWHSSANANANANA